MISCFCVLLKILNACFFAFDIAQFVLRLAKHFGFAVIIDVTTTVVIIRPLCC